MFTTSSSRTTLVAYVVMQDATPYSDIFKNFYLGGSVPKLYSLSKAKEICTKNNKQRARLRAAGGNVPIGLSVTSDYFYQKVTVNLV